MEASEVHSFIGVGADVPEHLRLEPLFEVDPPSEFSYNLGEVMAYQAGIPGRRPHARCTRCLRIYKGQPVHPLLFHDLFCNADIDLDHEDDLTFSALPERNNDDDTWHWKPEVSSTKND